jgi:hypothetical protein
MSDFIYLYEWFGRYIILTNETQQAVGLKFLCEASHRILLTLELRLGANRHDKPYFRKFLKNSHSVLKMFIWFLLIPKTFWQSMLINVKK